MTESKLIDIETDFAILRQRERPSKSESPPSESSSSEEDDEEEEEEEDKDTESTTSTRSEPEETEGIGDGAKDDSDVGMEDLSVAKMNGDHRTSSSTPSDGRHGGTVAFWNSVKSYGFIKWDGEDLFVHSKDLEANDKGLLRAGDAVTFEVADGRKGKEAVKVRMDRKQTPKRIKGECVRWDEEKGYGFLSGNDESENV